LKNTRKLQDDLISLQQQQKELAGRQALYNQQQLEFIARKNNLSAQQFDFADKLSTYNAQVKLFNENLEKMDTERETLQKEREEYETAVKEFEKQKAEFEAEKAKFEEEKATIQQERIDAQTKAMEDASGLQARITELQERENNLLQRENTLNEQLREFRTQPMYGGDYGQSPAPYGFQAQQQKNPFYDPISNLYDKAQTDGIKLNTAGNMRGYGYTNGYATAQPAPQNAAISQTPTKPKTTNVYNVGITLFKSAIILLCIVAFESLIVFFMKDYLQVSYLYPIVGFAVGFIAFLVCAIFYAKGYRPNARLRKHPSYFLTSAVIFVISVIIVTMIAVYCKAQVTEATQLLAYIIIPVVYLANILLFTAFYHLFSQQSKKH
jgi:hypothetical protein